MAVLLGAFATILACKHSAGDALREMSPTQVLLFSKTLAFRHDCIEPGIKAITQYFSDRGMKVATTEDANAFRPDELSKYDVVMFFQNTGNVLDSTQQKSFEDWYHSGQKGFVGIHAAADSGYDWPWFGSLIGAYFSDHPDIQPHIVQKYDTAHQAVRHLPDRWHRTDECYNYKAIPDGVITLLTLDETTYSGGTHGDFHPVSWCRDFEGGRTFYTAMGHTTESYSDSLFIEHIYQGVQWAAGKS